MKKITLIFVSLLSTNLIFAQPGGKGKSDEQIKEGFKGKGGVCKQLLQQQLGLTNAQRDKLFEVKKSHRKTMHTVKKAGMDLRFELRSLLLEEKLNEAKIEGLIKKVGENVQARLNARYQLVKQIKANLKPEQIKNLDLDTLWRGRRGGMGKGRGRGRGRGKGMGMGQKQGRQGRGQ
ncbi:MAG: Spy/CpxP family protein refolding chaperone [Bacteriovoracaceae bacterium]|nr:Spy/CpxP family protein refolding chaperone [Bacteriovoracaceae bacterium]